MEGEHHSSQMGLEVDDRDTTPLLAEENGVWMSDDLAEKIKKEYEGKKPADHWFYALLENLYGDLPWREMKRIAWLSLILFFIIGGFWILDSLKDAVFEQSVGLAHQPKAKLASVAVTVALVALYSRLCDLLPKHRLFYVFGGLYGAVFWALAALLTAAGRHGRPHPLVGWVSYLAIESWGSLAVALFWAFVNASVDLEVAESAYGLVVGGAQIGALAGATAAAQVKRTSVASLYQLAAAAPFVVAALMAAYVQLFPQALPEAKEKQRAEERRRRRKAVAVAAAAAAAPPTQPLAGGAAAGGGRAGGLRGAARRAARGVLLILRHRYVLLLFAMSCTDEIVLTVLDYEMKLVGVERFRGRADDFTLLLARFGQATNFVSLAMALCGVSWIVRRLGLRRTVLLFPALLTVAVLVGYMFPRLWVLFVCMSVLKGLTYSLFEPCVEMLFLPTTDEIKFKCKGWIDVVGARMAKALGSLITLRYGKNPRALATYGGLPSFLISLILLMVTVAVGEHFEALVASGKIVGEEDEEEEAEMEDYYDTPILMDEEEQLTPSSTSSSVKAKIAAYEESSPQKKQQISTSSPQCSRKS